MRMGEGLSAYVASKCLLGGAISLNDEEEALGRCGTRAFGTEEPQWGAGPKTGQPWQDPCRVRGATRGLEMGGPKLEGDGDEGACRAHKAMWIPLQACMGGSHCWKALSSGVMGSHGKNTQDTAEHGLQGEEASPVPIGCSRLGWGLSRREKGTERVQIQALPKKSRRTACKTQGQIGRPPETQWPVVVQPMAARRTDSEALQLQRIWKLLVGQMMEELIKKDFI